uniref:Uncharacterized protein n=1 Tax=Meloidogyne enterolobii TaxID=390850 RepID=A0A6V7VG83_MELEN|nr:unnamed protein product [Meloidogyne enterolobii]
MTFPFFSFFLLFSSFISRFLLISTHDQHSCPSRELRLASASKSVNEGIGARPFSRAKNVKRTMGHAYKC